MNTKKCSKCGEVKKLSDFRDDLRGDQQKRYRCIACDALYAKQYREKNKSKIQQRAKEYRENNKEKLLTYMKQWRGDSKDRIKTYREVNKEKISAEMRKYRQTHQEQLRNLNTEWLRKNPEKVQEYRKRAWEKTGRDRQRRKQAARRATDPTYKLKSLLSNRIRLALGRGSKHSSTEQLLGLSAQGVREYLESLFLPGMTWCNHGIDGWHIDHIIPVCSFDLSKEAEQKRCFHYTNLQPLWAIDNLRKAGQL